ncbi:hypothetical protein WKW77_34500 [Variovorax ureilyticus]|uniref:Trypsin-like peptidase domain-containing protein n=1 Tax=Variovorax ureilyticus TaxID=1836198 RepID=A0ABU8VR94_9BURK
MRRVKSVASLRAELDDRVGARADILGSMLGVKVRDGRATDQVGITYFVREKVPKAELSPRKRIPMSLRVGDQVVKTDVIAWPRMAEQALQAAPTIVSDGRTQGTLSCFALSSRTLFGITCAHCLEGMDQNPATPTPVVYYGAGNTWLPTGQSIYLAYSPGTAMSGDFGYLDCGLFELRDAVLAARARASKVIRVVVDLHSLVNQDVFGFSPLEPTGSSSPVRKARVLGVEAVAMGERCDVVLNVDPPGTFKGDSGILWITQDGRAAALHARGEIMAGMQGSRMTSAMSARRVSESLGSQLLVG